MFSIDVAKELRGSTVFMGGVTILAQIITLVQKELSKRTRTSGLHMLLDGGRTLCLEEV